MEINTKIENIEELQESANIVKISQKKLMTLMQNMKMIQTTKVIQNSQSYIMRHY